MDYAKERGLKRKIDDLESLEIKKRKNEFLALFPSQFEIAEKRSELDSLNEDLCEFDGFSELRQPILKALRFLNYRILTPIQRIGLSPLLRGRSSSVCAKTGSGKTLVYLLPVVNMLLRMNARHHSGIISIILLPTKDLAMQVHNSLASLLRHANMNVRAVLLCGGQSRAYEIRQLLKVANILVCTPGKLRYHMRNRIVSDFSNWEKVFSEIQKLAEERNLWEAQQNLNNKNNNSNNNHEEDDEEDDASNDDELQQTSKACVIPSVNPFKRSWMCMVNMHLLVVDEVDRFLSDAKLSHDLQEIVSLLPRQQYQTIVCSATANETYPEFLFSPLEPPLQLHDRGLTQETKLLEAYMIVEDDQRTVRFLRLLLHFIHYHVKAIVFFANVTEVEFFQMLLRVLARLQRSPWDQARILVVHGKLKPTQRDHNCLKFKNWKHGILFCTDTLSRGIDIPGVQLILQFDPPKTLDEYIHRIGRTARANSSGCSLLLLSERRLNILDLILTKRGRLLRFDMKCSLLNDAYEVVDYKKYADIVSSHIALLKLSKETCKRYNKSMLVFPVDLYHPKPTDDYSVLFGQSRDTAINNTESNGEFVW